MKEKLMSRKIFLGIALVAIAVGMELLSPRGLTDTMANYLLYMGIGYFMANVGVHGTEALKHAVNKKAQKAISPSTDHKPLTEALEALKAQNNELKELLNKTPQVEVDPAVKTSIQAVANQNAVMSQAINSIAEGTAYLVSVVQASTKK